MAANTAKNSYPNSDATKLAGIATGAEVNVNTDWNTTRGTGGSGTFDYEGRTYAYKTIGTQTWMTENPAYLPGVRSSSLGSMTYPYYYVYDYEGSIVSEAKATANYTTYGVLYNWEVAKIACPPGWHLPSDAEWTLLTDYLEYNGHGYGGSGNDIGKSMASTSGWTYNSTEGTIGNDQVSNNTSGFTALPGGLRNSDGNFYNLGHNALFWSASENDASTAWSRALGEYDDGMHRNPYSRSGGFSVRCLQNQVCTEARNWVNETACL